MTLDRDFDNPEYQTAHEQDLFSRVDRSVALAGGKVYIDRCLFDRTHTVIFMQTDLRHIFQIDMVSADASQDRPASYGSTGSGPGHPDRYSGHRTATLSAVSDEEEQVVLHFDADSYGYEGQDSTAAITIPVKKVPPSACRPPVEPGTMTTIGGIEFTLERVLFGVSALTFDVKVRSFTPLRNDRDVQPFPAVACAVEPFDTTLISHNLKRHAQPSWEPTLTAAPAGAPAKPEWVLAPDGPPQPAFIDLDMSWNASAFLRTAQGHASQILEAARIGGYGRSRRRDEGWENVRSLRYRVSEPLSADAHNALLIQLPHLLLYRELNRCASIELGDARPFEGKPVPLHQSLEIDGLSVLLDTLNRQRGRLQLEYRVEQPQGIPVVGDKDLVLALKFGQDGPWQTGEPFRPMPDLGMVRRCIFRVPERSVPRQLLLNIYLVGEHCGSLTWFVPLSNGG